ncbi:MAG: Ser-Thr-rich GPI-anchored membrane family protein, partial [Tepidisphaeraceae bacterium]
FAAQPGNTTAGTLPTLTVDVEDQWGNIITTDSSTVTIAAASGPGSAGGTLTASASNGVATFSAVTLDTPGSYTLTVTDGSDSSATSSSFTVSAAGASQLAFSVQPSNVAAGVANSPSIVVDVEDQFGNLASSDSSSVTLAVHTGPGSASGTLTVSASGGIATFSNVILDTAGAYTLTATDGSLTAATSSSFTVSAGSAYQVGFVQQPTSVAAGSTISPSVTVAVEDQYGNVVTTDSSNVTIAINTGSGTLNGTLTEAASSGVATFGNLSIDTTGNYTFIASDGSLNTAVSNSFAVTPASASQLAFNTQPSAIVAGVAISPSVVVDVEDQYGNLVTTDSSSVTLAAGGGTGSASGTLTVNASGGIATFSNVTVDIAGTYELTATDGSLSSASSNPFTVSAASAAELGYYIQPTNVTAGVADSTFVVDVEDQFGNIVQTDNSDVTVAVDTGPGSASGTLTVTASGGTADFTNVKLDTAGAYTLTATDGSLSPVNSSSFTVSAASASKLAFVQQPSDLTSGNPITPNVTVAVEDQFGNVVTTDSSQVTLAVASGPSGTGSSNVDAVNGIATFNDITPHTVGTYTLLATDGSLNSATSNSFAVTPGAANQLVYDVQPSNAVAGVANSPSIVVDVEDAWGNIVTSDSSQVSLTIATGPGGIFGTDQVDASSGVATFNNVILHTAGAYTLSARDGSLTSATSNSFTISAGSPTVIAYNVQPSNATAGVANSPSIVVDEEDQYGNLVTTDNTTNITLAVSSGPGSASGTLTKTTSGGVATFNNVVIDVAGAYQLTASDSLGNTVATSNSFSITATTPSQVVFVQQPTNVAALDTIDPSVTVAVEDQYNNIVTTDSSSVTLATDTGPGALQGTTTVSASSGIATFNDISLDITGSYTLAATDGSLTPAVSNSFTVAPAATHVVFNVQPSNAAAGAANSPSIVVDVENSSNVIVNTDQSDVTLAVATGPGSIAGTDTVAAVNGVATFTNVKFDTVGAYTITATDGSLTSATSGSFTITPAAAAQLAYATEPSDVAAGTPDSPAIVLDVEDQYGNLITTDSSSVTLSIASGPGNIYGTDTVNASSGVATFSNVYFHLAGAHTITASDGSLAPATSTSFNVTPAPAAHLIFVGQPTNVVAGAAISPSITVDVQDQFGNLVTTDSSSVTLAVDIGPGSVSGTDTVNASGGIATFSNVTVDTTGQYTLKATDGSLLYAESASFFVTPAAATVVSITTQPSNVTAGVAESPAIVVETLDAYGNLVTTDDNNIVLAIATGPGAIFGTDTVAASSGIATFSDVYFKTAGSYRITATDDINSVTTSNSFTVSPAAASQLAYAVQPSNAPLSVDISPAITVDVEDQYGNVVTTNSSNVTLAVASGPGSAGGTLTVAASSGVATFSNISFATAGNYTLTASDASLTAATSSAFTIGFALTTPSTGASVAEGGSYSIDWTGARTGDTVQLWVEGGPNNSWTELTTGVPEANGSYSWNTTGVDHGWYYFEAYDIPTSGTTYSAVSPDYLHITDPGGAAPNISMSNPPIGTASDAQGTNYVLDYSGTDGTGDTNPIYVQLWIYSGNTGQWSEVPGANYLSAAGGTYSMSTTDLTPGWYSFAAHATNGDQWSYTASPGWLNITVPTPTIAFTTPTSGQSVAAGGTFNLDWNINGLSSNDLPNSIVQIWGQHLVNGSPEWQELTASVPAANGTYAWTVPTSPGAGTYYAFSIWLNDGDMWWAQASPNWLRVS